jgi:hypothetical protein
MGTSPIPYETVSVSFQQKFIRLPAELAWQLIASSRLEKEVINGGTFGP